MTQITASAVKELRERTGAGMLDCKKALEENNADMDASIDYLRQKGLAKAAKKAGRVAPEGLVSVAVKGKFAVAIELNAETDFVARNEQFQKFLTELTEIALNNSITNVEDLKAASMNGTTVDAALSALIATIGENMTLRRVESVSVDNGTVADYMHSAIVPGKGKIGVLVGLKTSSTNTEKLAELGRKLAMHVAAANPIALTTASIDQDVVARERAIYAEKAKESGKPENIIEKMVEGSLRKFYEQVVLMEQTYIIDGETKISEVLKQAEKELGAPVEISSYVRLELGEGVEKKEENFAEEVNKVACGC